MDKILIAIGAAVAVPALLILAVILGTLFGAISGWIVGWFFGETVLHVLASFGVTGVTMWQLGAFLGFVGPFFRSYQNVEKAS